MPTKVENKRIELFLDSGAFSAWTKSVEIRIEDYAEFIKQYKHVIQIYANLDVLGDPVKTWSNQKWLEKQGLSPIPCYHYGESENWLQRYITSGYDYIALGGMVPIQTTQRIYWLDHLFSKLLTNKDGLPIVKIHGFGMTSIPLLLRYPWYSVDSTSWVVTSRMGGVMVPKLENAKWTYNTPPWNVAVSNKNVSSKVLGTHIDSFPPKIKQVVLSYFDQKKYKLGKSMFRTEDDSYKLKDNEKWVGKQKTNQRMVETIVEEGLSNCYQLRDELNLTYFQDLETALPKWPWPFKIDKMIGFFDREDIT